MLETTEQRPAGPPAGITVEEAVRAVAEVLEDRVGDWGEICPSTPLAGLGLDSFDVAELFMILEELAGDPIDPRSGDGLTIVGDLTRLRLL
jgi:acyl carrier protein